MKQRQPYNPDRHAHPGLAAIALLEAGKAVLAFLAAAGLEISGPAPLRNIVNTLVRRVGADPEHGSFSNLLDLITPDTVHVGVIALVAYGLLRAPVPQLLPCLELKIPWIDRIRSLLRPPSTPVSTSQQRLARSPLGRVE